MLCDPEGSVLGVGSGGRSNYHNNGLRNALASLKRAFEGALAQSGLPRAGVGLAACFGLAGLDSPEGHGDGEARASGRWRWAWARRSDLVVNDWRTAVAGAFIDEPGVTLIAGTGCVAAAQRDRRHARWSGWAGGGTSSTTGGAPTTSGGTRSTRR